MMNQYQQASDRTLGMLVRLQADESAAFCRQLVSEINHQMLNNKHELLAQSDSNQLQVRHETRVKT